MKHKKIGPVSSDLRNFSKSLVSDLHIMISLVEACGGKNPENPPLSKMPLASLYTVEDNKTFSNEKKSKEVSSGNRCAFIFLLFIISTPVWGESVFHKKFENNIRVLAPTKLNCINPLLGLNRMGAAVDDHIGKAVV